MGDKQQINLMAARLCGRKVHLKQFPLDAEVSLVDSDTGIKTWWDIFAATPQGAWCREQVVKTLEKDHRILIMWLPGTNWNFSCGQGEGDGSYPGAIAGAVQHVSKQ